MNTTLLSTINVMNFNNIAPTRSLVRKAYGPSTDFLFNNFTASKSFTDYIDRNAEQKISDFMERFEDNTSSLSDVSSDLARLFLDVHKNKDISVDSETLTAIAKNNAEIQQYSLSVEQLATIQIDTSNAFKKDTAELSGGSKIDFSIQQGTHKFELSVDIEDLTSNQDILKKVSTAINQSSADLKAKILFDDDDNVRLSIESKRTGTETKFEVSGQFVDSIGLDTHSSASNAEYTLNNETFESESNTISIDHGNVEITFNDATDETETVSVTLDTSNIEDQFDKLSTELQNISELFEDFRGESRLLSKYERRFDHLMTTYKDELGSIGINKSEAGYITFLKENIAINSAVGIVNPPLQVNQPGTMIDKFTKFALDLKTQDIRTLVPSNVGTNLPTFTDDDFITYLSFSNRFNVNAFYPTGNILDFML